MNYKLAKELNEKGFPQDYKNPIAGWGGGGDLEDIHNPTLEELIEACGEIVITLVNSNDEKKACHTPDRETICYQEETLNEAVAQIWLSLNNK